ncbi:MAG: sulfatase [Bacteroidia bacterium]|nr:sulfatase [Bacteroidia bacterium]
MNLKGDLKLYILFTGLIVVGCSSKKKSGNYETMKKPNVIFILADDMGYSDISCYGAKEVKTPHLDLLAAKGLRFTDFHTAASICSPSRAAFLTGAYPQRCGLYMGIDPNREAHWFLGLNPDEITLAEQFKKQNYNTMMVGKWHIGTEDKFSYYNQGFDHYYGMPCNFDHDPRFFDEKKVIYKNTPLDKLTELYTNRIVNYINEQKEKPFFLYYAHNYPHTPYLPGEKFKGSSQDGIRGDVIQEMDWSVGEIIKALEKNGILDNTLLIFTSDNGPVNERYASPYRGTKFTTLEGGHRVPFILYWKDKIKQPRVCDVPVNAMDLFPTLSEIIEEPLPSDSLYDGISLIPLFLGKSFVRTKELPFYYYNCENLQAIRLKDWKLHLPRTVDQTPWWQRNKEYHELNEPMLFNLTTDKGESKNVADLHPELVSKLLRLADQARVRLGEYNQHGTEQRPTGTIFPEVPVIGNQSDWEKLMDKEKGKGKSEFKKIINVR